jgi:hypothetical protein
MNSTLHDWLRSKTQRASILACGLRLPDQSCFSQSYSKAFSPAQLDQTWQRLAETVQSLSQHRIAATRLRWTYDQSQLYFAMRSDGTAFGMFTLRSPSEADQRAIDQLIGEFLTQAP